jgi:hypothetical protein
MGTRLKIIIASKVYMEEFTQKYLCVAAKTFNEKDSQRKRPWLQ